MGKDVSRMEETRSVFYIHKQVNLQEPLGVNGNKIVHKEMGTNMNYYWRAVASATLNLRFL